MTDIHKFLDQIMKWLQQNQPEFAASFLPGLTDEQISVIIRDLPYHLLEEMGIFI